MVCEICDKKEQIIGNLSYFLETWEKELRALNLYETAEKIITEKDMLILTALCRLLNERMPMIHTITTLKTIYGYKNPAHAYELGTRVVGYFHKLETAKEAVESNACDIYEEGYYPFCVIESTFEGFYGFGDEYWYQWIDGGYKPIDKPESLRHVCGFGIG